MSWKDILKTEKAHCGSEKTDEEPIIEKIPDLSGDGKVTQKDVLIGRGVYDKKGNKVKKAKALPEKTVKEMEKLANAVLREIQKEGGALGMKNLEKLARDNPERLKEVLTKLKKEGKIFVHKDGDIYTHKPSKGRGFTA